MFPILSDNVILSFSATFGTSRHLPLPGHHQEHIILVKIVRKTLPRAAVQLGVAERFDRKICQLFGENIRLK
jgi:hypothetical protein